MSVPGSRTDVDTSRPRVGILVDPSDSWGRAVVLGISKSSRHSLNWDLLIAPRDDQWRLRVPLDWKGDGVIVALRDRASIRHVHALKLPTVIVSSWEATPRNWCRVNTDDRVRAELALQHFLDRGFQHFAYYGPPSVRYSERRGLYFRHVLKQAGLTCFNFRMSTARRGWASMQKLTLQWLNRLPRPLAVLAADPYPALQLTEICRTASIRIPEEVAILSGDSDDLICKVSSPPLSSIVLAGEKIGEESARILQLLMEKKKPESRNVLIPPVGVADRQSTDILAINDPLFVDALRFIRDHAHTGIRVQDVLQVVAISRRGLEQRFQQHLGHTPADEIRKMKLERAKQLLASTDMPVEQVAEASGYSSPSQLGFVFRKQTGQTPLKFRRENHWRSDAK